MVGGSIVPVQMIGQLYNEVPVLGYWNLCVLIVAATRKRKQQAGAKKENPQKERCKWNKAKGKSSIGDAGN